MSILSSSVQRKSFAIDMFAKRVVGILQNDFDNLRTEKEIIRLVSSETSEIEWEEVTRKVKKSLRASMKIPRPRIEILLLLLQKVMSKNKIEKVSCACIDSNQDPKTG
jgi:hypothetical protein